MDRGGATTGLAPGQSPGMLWVRGFRVLGYWVASPAVYLTCWCGSVPRTTQFVLYRACYKGALYIVEASPSGMVEY